MSYASSSSDESQTFSTIELQRFVVESNRIEGIAGYEDIQVRTLRDFLALKKITVEDLVKFVAVYQPDAMLRDKPGMNVRVGMYVPPPGGKNVVRSLELLLKTVKSYTPFYVHKEYEKLHPFTDCNGRSGRAIWLWMHRRLDLPFLHAWYYQSLAGE